MNILSNMIVDGTASVDVRSLHPAPPCTSIRSVDDPSLGTAVASSLGVACSQQREHMCMGIDIIYT